MPRRHLWSLHTAPVPTVLSSSGGARRRCGGCGGRGPARRAHSTATHPRSRHHSRWLRPPPQRPRPAGGQRQAPRMPGSLRGGAGPGASRELSGSGHRHRDRGRVRGRPTEGVPCPSADGLVRGVWGKLPAAQLPWAAGRESRAW